MEVLNPPPQEFWEGVLKNCEQATFFHSPTWLAALEKTFPDYTNATLGFTFSSGNRALIPIMADHAKGRFLKKIKHKSMALGTYGGIISERTLSPEESRDIFEHLTSGTFNDLNIVDNPLSQLHFPESLPSKSLFTHIIYIDCDFEQLTKRFSRGHRSNIKQAEKKGVRIRCADSLADFERYYQVYGETIKRWGEEAGTIYPWELFLNLYQEKSPDIKLWLAEKQETIIAGVLALYCNATILYWHGSSLREYFDHYPNNLLHREIIKDGCLNGYRLYDLNPSGGHPGVVRFKESLSARRVDFRSYHWKKRSLTKKGA